MHDILRWSWEGNTLTAWVRALVSIATKYRLQR